MYKIDFNQPCHIHFIGIGGISMSGLAEILLEEGFTVSGSDNKESALTDHLSQNGATVFYGQKASNIIDGIDLVVYTAAIHEDNEEFAEAKRQNLPMLSRAELLGQLMTNFIKKGDDPNTAWEKAKGQYGRVADAVKIIDPRKE